MAPTPSRDPVRTPDEDSPQGQIAELEEEIASLRRQLEHERRTRAAADAELRRTRIRADELQSALQQNQEQFLDMLSKLQDREEQAVRRAVELAERTAEAEAARTRAEEAERGLRKLIDEAGKLLSASLDYRATLTHVARLAAPELADWCIIDVLDQYGRVERVAAWGPEREQGLARRLVAECEPGGDYGLHRALAGDDTAAARPVDEEFLRTVACKTDLLDELDALHASTALVVPLLARGQLLGAMALLAGPDRQAYGEDDRLLARELARRAAIAVDNARLYDAALAGSRSKSEFLAVMSHELRTPLSAIIGYSDLLRTGVAGDVNEKQEEQLGRIRSSADHLLELIEEILAFSQLEAGKAELEPEPIDAARLTVEVAALVEPLAGRKGIELVVRGTDEPVRMKADPGKLRQVLVNLVANAIKFTDEGRVEVVLEPEGGRIRWSVIDTGIGIEARHMEEIFTPFWQVEQSRTRRNEGSGLGLTVARRLVQLMGGRMVIESEVGVGSTFSIEIPREPAGAA